MKRWSAKLAVLAVLANAATAWGAFARPGDAVHLSASGIMSSGLMITIDLQTGQSIKRTTPRGSVGPGEKIEWKENRRLLSADELQALKAVINRGLDEGFRSKACRDADRTYRAKEGRPAPPQPPNMDALVTFDVVLDGRRASGPETGCESPAYDAVWKTATALASVGETASGR